MADFEWDSKKESLNVRNHGVDFTTAALIWNDFVYRRDYGEARLVAFGIAESRILAVVYTPRAEARRIISARIAHRRERRHYEEEIARRGRPPQD
jgi:uncharacterized DUF497 family protein